MTRARAARRARESLLRRLRALAVLVDRRARVGVKLLRIDELGRALVAAFHADVAEAAELLHVCVLHLLRHVELARRAEAFVVRVDERQRAVLARSSVEQARVRALAHRARAGN